MMPALKKIDRRLQTGPKKTTVRPAPGLLELSALQALRGTHYCMPGPVYILQPEDATRSIGASIGALPAPREGDCAGSLRQRHRQEQTMGKKHRRAIPRFATPIIETHCHLDYLDAEQLSHTMQQCAEVGIEHVVTVAVAPDNLERVLELTRFAPNIWGTQGVHPHEAAQYSDATDVLIRARCAQPRIVAVGEIGLDYYYDHAERALQRAVFARQLQIAADTAMPVVIHTRDADDDTRAILREFSGTLARGGVIHSFTSSPELAEFCLAEGFMLGFNGITTFNRADEVRAVVAATPAQRILLETDAPYLTPAPYRGRPNAPHFLPFIAERIAQVKSLDVEELLQQVYRNSVGLFFGGDVRLRAAQATR